MIDFLPVKGVADASWCGRNPFADGIGSVVPVPWQDSHKLRSVEISITAR